MLPSRAIGIIINMSFLVGNNFDNRVSELGGSYILNMVEGTTFAAVSAVLTTTTFLCIVAKVVYL